VIVTMSRNTEGTAVGYNKKKKGARSYYPFGKSNRKLTICDNRILTTLSCS